MGKDTCTAYKVRGSKKNLVGQPIFRQIIKLIPRDKFNELAIKHKSDRYYKTFFSWEQLVTMLRGVEKFAPWVRKVHFVTCGQKPEWLDI